MKRYLKLISLVTFITLTIAIFYIQSSLANKKHPEFFIKAKNGDVEEIEKLSLSAMFNDRHALSIDKSGSTYEGQSSYLDQLQYEHTYGSKVIKQLIKEHRHFMRAKDRSPVLYFANDQMLAYVNVAIDYEYDDQGWKNEYSFEVSILNKKTNKTTTANIQVPDANDYEILDVEGVQIVDEDLKIVTANYRHDESLISQSFIEPHVYTVSLDTLTITDDEKIGVENDLFPDERLDANGIFNGNDIGVKQYIGFTFDHTKIQPGDDGHDHLETIDQKFIVYNFQTGDQTVIELPEEYEQSYDAEVINENILYLSERTDDAFKVVTYDIVEQEIITEQSFDLPVELVPHGLNAGVADGKVYIFSSYKPQTLDAILQVGDVATGEILFDGTIEHVRDSKLDEEHELNIYNVLFE